QLRSSLVIPSITGRSVAGGPCRANGSGICRCPGFGAYGISGTGRRRWATELQREPVIEDMAVGIRDEESGNTGTGKSHDERHRDAVADGNAVSGPHDAVAVLAGQSQGDQEVIQETIADCGVDGNGEFGTACGRWDKDFFTGVGTGRFASGTAGKEVEAVG